MEHRRLPLGYCPIPALGACEGRLILLAAAAAVDANAAG